MTMHSGFSSLQERWHIELFSELMTNLPEPPGPKEIEPVWAERAAEEVLLYLRGSVESSASQWWTPADILWTIIIDWLISDDRGWPRTRVDFLIPEEMLPERFWLHVAGKPLLVCREDLSPGSSRGVRRESDAT